MHSSKLFTYALCLLVAVSGCTSFMEKRTESQIRRDRIRKQLEAENRPTLVSQLASPRQLAPALITNIGLITNLADTGGPVSPSQQREKMLDVMRRNEVPNPNALLDSKQTALVIIKSPIAPAAQAGERYDVSVELSKHSQASDLRQGWLRETPMVEMAQFEGRVRTSFDYAKAEGSLVTYAQYTGSTEEQHKLQAVVVGGAKLVKSRELGIGITEEYADAITMGVIAPAINTRFTYFDGSSQKGVATPQSDDYMDLKIPSRYKQDPHHFVNVVLRVGFNESDEQRKNRIKKLSNDLTNPTMVREACWQLEALGESTADVLAEQINNPNEEIRFYCAHSLAYLGDRRSIPVLKELAYRQAAFRKMSIDAMASIDNFQAEEALKSLLHCDEPEARYGAVLALRHRNPRDPVITAQQTKQLGGLLEIPSSGPDLVAVSVRGTPEVVFFGQVPMVALPKFHNVNPNILIQQTGANEMTITRFVPGQDDISVKCLADLRSILNGIGQVGGGYGDWVSFVRECKELGFMSASIAMDPVPLTGRAFDRETGSSITDPEQLVKKDEETEVTATATQWYKPWTWWN